MARRTLHFWNDGFSVDDGELYRTDIPENAEILQMIRTGRAPISIMNVLPQQEVDVHLKEHDTNYVKPKQKYTPFGGGGQRLGSPTPDVHGNLSQQASTSAPANAHTTRSVPTPSSQTIPQVNESEPIISLQIRFGDGTRRVARFNVTHTISDVYDYVDASAPVRDRPWALMTTFPSKELSDKSVVLGDMAEFKRGGVVVQKWT